MRLFNRLSDESRSSDVNQENKVFRGRKSGEGKRRADASDSFLSPRKLGMETLEERQLLSVNPIGNAEYQEIRDAYQDLVLPSSLSEINVIELTDLNAAALQGAVDQAAQTPGSDLILLRTTADDYVLDLESTAIKINIDSAKYGDLTILSRGEQTLTVETRDTNAFTVLNGNVAFDGMVLYNYTTTEYAADLVVTTPNATATLGATLFEVNQIAKTDAETGEATTTYSVDKAMTSEELQQYGLSAVTNVSGYRTLTNLDGDFNAVRNTIHATLRSQYDYFGWGYNPTRYMAVDATQIYDAESPSSAGWVGTVANMLAYTGWAEKAGFSTSMTLQNGSVKNYNSVEDAVADYLNQNFINSNAGTNPNAGYVLNAAQIINYLFSGDDSGIEFLTNTVEGGAFFTDIDFSSVGGYVASSDSMIDDALAALRAGNAVTMEVQTSDNYGNVVREYVSVWGYYYNRDSRQFFGNVTNNSADYVGLVCSNPKMGSYQRQVTDTNYAVPGGTETRTMTHYTDQASTAADSGENDYNTYHTYLLQRVGTSWRFATAPYTYIDTNGAVQGASSLPEGFQYFGTYRNSQYTTYTSQIVGFSWIQQYSDKLSSVAVDEKSILALESMPGNTDNVIYLHFAGAEGNGWDGLAHPALDLDGSAGYGVSELKFIEEVWRRVAEDYAPFNVNVTTNADVFNAAEKGIRVVIGGYSASAGGVAYVGSFGTQKQDCYVYPYSLNLSAKSVAEAASHETGHTFGLAHDGYEHNEYYNGNATWAPIMGNSYGSLLTQWSSGDYVNANNQQDDVAIIASVVGYRADDFGDTIETAEPLENHYVAVDINDYDATSGTYYAKGIIENRDDYDAFSFVSNGGTYVVDVSGDGADSRFIDGDFNWTTVRHGDVENPVFGGKYYAKSYDYTNLNVQVSLLDENGAVVLIGLDGAVMKLGYGEKTVVASDNRFYVVDQFGKKVYNADGSLKEGYLAIDDSTYTTFSHFVTPALESGKTYYISVAGVGQGNDATNGYSDYGSLGQYALSMHESYENFRLDDVRMDVESLDYATGVDNVLNWQEALVYSGRRLENGQSYLGNTLTFNSNLSGQTLELNETLTFAESRSLVGKPYSEKRFVLDATPAWDNTNDQPGITIDANEKFRAVYVDNTTVELYGFIFTGGVAETTNVIYLYFGGIDGTGWSGELHPAFDLDGDPTTFNEAELDYINEVYLRVAEDYSPYNVTVTTDQSVYEAATNAIRVVVGGTGNNRGGVAYVGSFGTSKQDCYVFPNSLGNAKNTAEAISHEVGHTMGLRHDGKETVEYYGGGNGWAPIMGVGYYEVLTQWSRGEYNGATNVEDDLATIAARLGYKDDDYGNSADDASALRESYLRSGNFVADGLLERTGDVDFFSFIATSESFVIDVVGTGADYANANAEGYAASLGFTNLDLKVELYDADGNLLYTCNPESSLFAHFEANNLTVGENYYLRVSGTGKGDPTTTGYSNYGSVGQYFVTASAGTLASFVGENRYESNTTKIAIRNGAQNATKEAAVGHGKNGQTNNGGGIYNNYGWLTIGDSIIAGNRALKAGGGIYNAGGEYENQDQHDGWLYLINTSIIGNATTAKNSVGGGIYNESGGVATLVNATIAGNKADYSGGGIQNAGVVRLVNSIVAKNDADYGADVYTQSGKSTVAYYSLIGDESRNADYTAYKNGTNTQNAVGSLIGTSAGSSVSSPVNVIDSKFVSFREYADENWSSELWKSWNLRLQGDSAAVNLGATDWLNARVDFTNSQVAASKYAALGQNRYYFAIADYPVDLAGQARIGGASVDAGAYEVLEKPDLTGFIPTSAGSDVVNDWENSIVVSRAVDDQTGSIAPFLVDEQLYLNLAFVNQGVAIGTNFETTVYLWKYAPNATKEQMFAASKIDGSEVAFLKISVEFEATGSMPGAVGAKIIATNLATGETTTFNYDGSTSYIALPNLGVGSVEEIVSGLIANGSMTAQNEEGYYVFGYQLDSKDEIAEHNETNNVFLTTGYFDVVESPVSLNDSIVVTTTADVVDAYDGEISLREAVEIYAGSFYYREIALPESATFESGGVTYKVQGGKFYVDSSTDYKVYPGESFTFVETVQTALTWNATEASYQDADGNDVVFTNGTKGAFSYEGTDYTDALWDSATNSWTVEVAGVAKSIAAVDAASVVITQNPVVTVAYKENVYFLTDETGEKAIPVGEGTTAKFNGVDVVMKGGVWTKTDTKTYDRDGVQALGNFFLADGTEVAVVNGVFRRVATNDVAVVLDGATVTLANGETAVYDSAKDRFTVTTVAEYAIHDGDSIEIGGQTLKFVAKAYVDAADYRYYLNDGTVVTLANGYEVAYRADRDAFVFASQTLARKLDAGSTVTWQGKDYSYKAGVAIVEKASREANAVVFESALDGQTFELELGQLTLTKSFTLDCVDPNGNLLDLSIKSDDSRLFLVEEGADVTIKNFNLKDSGFATRDAEDVGGVVFNKGALTIEQVVFSGNEALYGGSIYNVGALSVVDSSFEGDKATAGGSIYNGVKADGTDAILTVKNTKFDLNFAENGGAIYNVGTAELTSVQFSNDGADSDGGAVYNDGSFVGVDLSFSLNCVKANGGAIYNVGTAYVAGSNFSSPNANIGATNGGAIFNATDAELTVETSTFDGMGATANGGAIYAAGTATVAESVFQASAAQNGAAIYAVGKLEITNGRFEENGAKNGGAIYAVGKLEITNGRFEENGAENGGAIYAEGPTSIVGTTFDGNAASENGGAIYAKGALNLVGVAFVGSKAQNGAAIYAEGALNAANSTFFKNVATADGGAIYATGTTSLVNVTIAGNEAADGAGLYNAGTATLDNSILAENKATGADAKGFDLYTAAGATTTLRGSLLANIAYCGNVEYALDGAYRSLLGVDPQFVDSANGDYSLKATSPAINAGSNALDGGATVDYAGNARRVGLIVGGEAQTVDMGAFEFQTVVAPNLAIQTDSVKYWTAQHKYEGATKPEEESYYVAGQDVCFEFDVKNIGDGIVLDNWAYSVKLVGIDKNGNVVYDRTQASVKYADEFDRFDWLNQADWIFNGDSKNMLANLGALPAGYYTMTLSIDVDGIGNVYEWGEEDGYVGDNDNAFSGAFNVYEAPSVVVTTEKDVVDPTDYLVSLREAVLYAGEYENVSKFTVQEGQTFVLDTGEILTVRNGMLTRKIDVVYKEGGAYDLHDGDAFYFNSRSVFYRYELNGGYFVDLDGKTVDVSTGSLTYPDGTTATVALKSDQYVEFVGNPTSDLNPSEGDRYSYRVLQIPGQTPVRLTDGATFEYSNVTFTYYETYVDADGKTLDGAFVFEDGTVQEYRDGGTLQIANLKIGGLSTRDELVSGPLTLADGATLEVFDGIAQRTQAVGTTITFAESMRGKTITVDENLGRILLNKELKIDGEDRGVAVSGDDKVGIFEVATLDATKSVSISNLTLKQGRGAKGGAIYNAGTLTVQNVSFVANKVYLTGVPTSGLLTDGLGGAIYNAATGTLTVDGGAFSGNVASEFGGAIFSMGETNVSGATFDKNVAFAGGAIAAQAGTAFVSDATFNSNEAERGGAVYAVVDATINNSTFNANKANADVPYEAVGGAIYATETSVLTLSGTSAFVGNVAGGYGGAVYVAGKLAEIVGNLTATENQAGFDGGALCVNAALSVVGDVVLTGNKAGENGGAATLGGSVSITGNAVVSNNEAGKDKGAFSFRPMAIGATMKIGGDADFSGNVAKGGKFGAFAVDSLTVGGSLVAVGVQAETPDGYAMNVLRDVKVGGNVEISQSRGIGLYSEIGDVEIAGSATFEKNVATSSSALYTAGYLTIGAGATLTGNRAGANYGAIYAGGNVEITGALTATNNVATEGAGGAIYAVGALTVKNDATDPENIVAGNVVLTDNAAGTDGGAIYAASISIEGNATARNNQAGYNGGALNASGAVYVGGTSTFENNVAGTKPTVAETILETKTLDDGTVVVTKSVEVVYDSWGGAINSLVSVELVGDATFTGNSANSGGAINAGGIEFAQAGTVAIDGSATFVGNVAQGGETVETVVVTTTSDGESTTETIDSTTNDYDSVGGGAIWTGTLTIAGDATLTDNKSLDGNGGAILAETLTIVGALNASGNKAEYSGGAIYTTGHLTIGAGATLTGNRAGANYGAVYAGGNVEIAGALTATNNVATEGAGGALYVGGALTVKNDATDPENIVAGNVVLTGNTAGTDGGAIYAASISIDGTLNATANAAGTFGVLVETTSQETVGEETVDATTQTTTWSGKGGAIYVSDGDFAVGGDATFGSDKATTGGAIYVETGAATFGGSTTFDANETTATERVSVSTDSTSSDTFVGADAGAAFVKTTLTVRGDLTLTGNKASEDYGAVYAFDGIVVDGSLTAKNNAASAFVAAVFTNGDLTIGGALTAEGNVAGTAFGAVCVGGDLTVGENVELKSNRANASYGAVYVGGNATVDGTLNAENNAATTGDGGALCSLGRLTIGAGATLTGNRAGANYGAIYAGGNVEITGALTATNNVATEGAGGAIYAVGALTVKNDATDPENIVAGNVVLTDNAAGTDGGAIYAASVAIEGALNANGNDAQVGSGGAIFAGTNLTITGAATATDNASRACGGAFAAGGNIAIGGSATFEKNKVGESGGAINANGTVTIEGNATFVDNVAGDDGGAINAGGAVQIDGTSAFERNIVGALPDVTEEIVDEQTLEDGTVVVTKKVTSSYEAWGGAIYSGASVTFGDDAKFVGNSANSGGAIAADGDVVFGGNATLADNSVKVLEKIDTIVVTTKPDGATTTETVATETSTYGVDGAGAIDSNGSITIIGDATITGNQALGGFAGAVYAEKNLTIVGRATITDNSADRSGGAIYVGGSVSLQNSLLSKNVAGENGGAIYATDATLVNVTVADNAAQNGGGVYVLGNATIDNSILAGNVANPTVIPGIGDDPAATIGGEGADLYVGANATVAPRNSLVQNVENMGPGSLTLINDYRCILGVAPEFVDAANGDYSLKETSPAINAGKNALAGALGNVDLAGNARIVGLVVDGTICSVDMGAYEYQTVIAADLAFGENPASFWYSSTGRNETNPSDVVRQDYYIFGEDVIFDFAFANLGTGKIIDKFDVVLTVEGLAADGSRINTTYRYQEGSDYCEWLRVSDWLEPNESYACARQNLGTLPVGEYTLTLTLDSANEIVELDEENNVYTTNFKVYEQPSVAVTTDQDVVDPLDGKISLREAVEVYGGPLWYSQKTLVADGTEFVAADLTKIVVKNGAATIEQAVATIDDGTQTKLVEGLELPYGRNYVSCETVGNRVYLFTNPDGTTATYVAAADAAPLTLTFADGSIATVKTIPYYEYVAVTGQTIKPATESVDVVVLDEQTIALNDLTSTSLPYAALNVVYHKNAFVGLDGTAFFVADGTQVNIDGFQGTLTNGGIVAKDGSYLMPTVGQTVVVDGVTATYRGGAFALPDGSIKELGETFVCENGMTIDSFNVEKTTAEVVSLVDGRAVQIADGIATVATYVDSTVTFADSLDGKTIAVDATLGPIAAARNVEIDASNIELTVSGDGKSGVFVVLPGVEATMKSFSIKNGAAERGAGLLNQGTTTLIDVAFVGNQATGRVEGALENLTLTKGVGGAIYNVGTLTIENGVFSQNAATYYGGAICSVGTLEISDSIFGANKSGFYGGAIYVQNGSATIDDSRFTANQAAYGAAIALAASVSSADLTISNSLLAKNVATGANANVYVLRGRGPAGGAIYADGANASVATTNVTVVDNVVKNAIFGNETFNGAGGAIALANGAKLALANSIVAQNVAESGTDIYGDAAATATVKSSLIGVGDDCGFALTTDLTNRSFVGTVSDPMSPVLDANYVPTAISSAVNAGTNALALSTSGNELEFDLAGNVRIVGGAQTDGTIFAVDMGAFEYQTIAAPDLAFGDAPFEPRYATITIDAPTTKDFVEGFDVEFSYEFGNIGTALTVDSFVYTITVVQLDADGNDVRETEKVYRKVYGDGSNGFLDRAEWLLPDETVSGDWNLGELPVGQYRLAFALDVDNNVVELNEGNNVYETTFGVRERPSLVVTTENDVVDPYDGQTSLREALALISQSGETTVVQNGIVETLGQTITFADSVKGKTIAVDSTRGELSIDRSTTIDGTGANVVLSGQDATRILRTTGANASVSIFDLTFANGDAAIGGAIYNSAKLTLTNASFTGNGKAQATNGGAVYNDATGILTLTNASFVDNAATDQGGALYNAGTALVDRQTNVAQVEFQGNDAQRGGAVYNKGTLTLANAAFVDNAASEQGGAVYNEGGTLVVSSASFDGNKAQYGGALVNYQGIANVSNATFTSNVATVSAGAVDNYGDLYLTDVLFEQNSANVAGGALYNSASLGENAAAYRAFFDKVSFNRNQAGKTGGAVYNAVGSILGAFGTISFKANVAAIGGALSNFGNLESNAGTDFLSNQATNGAGGAVYNEGSVVLTNATFEANQATTDGGAAANVEGASFSATNANVKSNQAGDKGGAFFNQGTLSVSNSVVWKNKANVGGAIANVRSALAGATGATTTLRSSTIAANSATTAGGVYNVGKLDAYNAVLAGDYAATAIDLYSTGNATFYASLLGSNEGVNVAPVRKGVALSGEPGFQVAPSFDANGVLTNDGAVNLRPISTGSIVNVGNDAYALDATEKSTLTVDLDGNRRVCNRFAQIDLGAYEYQFEDPSLVVTSENDVVDPTDGKISLREAIDYAKKYGAQFGSTITFAGDVTKIELTSAVTIDADVVVDASSVGGVVLDASKGEGARRVLEIAKGANVELIALSITGGNMEKTDGSDDPDYCGGGVYNEGNLTLTNVQVYDNAANYGGGVCNAGTMKIYRSTIKDNSGSYYGGGYSYGDLYVENSTISGNFATYQGGGFGVYTSKAQFVGVAAYGNYSEIGGAFFVSVNTNSQNLANSGTTFTNCTIVGNVASSAGAGIWAKRDVAVDNSIVYGNSLLSATGNSADLYWVAGGVSTGATFANSIVGQTNIAATGAKNYDPSFVEFAQPTFADAEVKAWKTNAKSAFDAWTAWESFDLNLQLDSKAIDSGSNELLPGGFATDLAGNRRIVGSVVDLGAYEEQGNVAPTSIHFDVVSPFYSTNAVGTTVATARAVDANADDTFVYEIVAGSEFAEYFAIGGQNNDEIVLKKAIPAGEYLVEALATDSGSATCVDSFVLTVTNPVRRYDVPTITSVSNVGMRTIDVFWTVDGQAAKEYVAEYRVDGGEWLSTNALTGSHGVIEGLFAKGQVVDVRIKALASVEFDESDWSNVATRVVQRTSEAFNVDAISLNEGRSLVLKVDSVSTAHSTWRVVWGDGSETVYDSLTTRINAAHVYSASGAYAPTLFVDGGETPFVLANHTVEIVDVVESGAALEVGETLSAQTANVFSAVAPIDVEAAPIAAASNVLAVVAQAPPVDVKWSAFDAAVEVVAETEIDPIVLVAQPTTRRELAAAFQARQNVFANFDVSDEQNDETVDFEIELKESFDNAFDEAFLNDLFEEN